MYKDGSESSNATFPQDDNIVHRTLLRSILDNEHATKTFFALHLFDG